MKTKVTISILTVILLILNIFSIGALAAISPISNVSASYSSGITTVSGSSTYSKLLIVVLDSDANQVAIDNVDVINGSFSKNINTGILANGATHIVRLYNLYGGNYTEKSFIANNSNSGGSTATNPTPTTVPTPMPDKTNIVKEIADATTVIDEKTGRAVAQMTEEQISTVINKAVESIKNQVGASKSVIEIKIQATNIKEAVLELPKEAIKTMVESKLDTLSIDTGIGTLALDKKTLNTIKNNAVNENSDAKLKISVESVNTAVALNEYSKEAQKVLKEKIGDRPILDFKIQVGETKISNFKGGTINITLPYIIKDTEGINEMVIFYVDDNGNMKAVPNSKYDVATKSFRFGAKHFSRYAVGYNKVSFNDVDQHAWYNKAISYIASRSVVNGIDTSKFAPEKNVSRADFLIMVMRAYRVEVDSNVVDNFIDAGNKYYTNYISTAKQLGLVTGSGNNLFEPEENISRQDMFVILYRVLEKLEELPTDNTGKTLQNFSDIENINNYANSAMKLFVETGVITGDGNKLTPKATSTRAQAAQVLYNLLSK